MNHFNILIPLIFIYIGMLYLLYIYLKKDYSHEFEFNNVTTVNTPITSIASRILNYIFFIQIIALFIIPVIVMVMTFTNSESGTWGIDISIFSGFKIDLSKIEGIESFGVRNPEFSGQTMINIDTSNLNAWYINMAIQELYLLVSLYVIYQLRFLIISVRKGLALSNENSQRIKKIGIVIMVVGFLVPIIEYFIWGSIVNGITFNTEGFKLYPAFQVKLRYELIGIMLVILAKVLQEAAEIKKEQELTI